MNSVLKIMTIFFLLNSSNVFASEADVKVKKQNKSIFKTLTRKSLNKAELLIFLSEYVIIIDKKKRDNGLGKILTKEWMNDDLLCLTFCNNISLKIYIVHVQIY